MSNPTTAPVVTDPAAIRRIVAIIRAMERRRGR